MSYPKKNWRGLAHESFFGYDNDKALVQGPSNIAINYLLDTALLYQILTLNSQGGRWTESDQYVMNLGSIPFSMQLLNNFSLVANLETRPVFP